jgi:hypothetical protein
MKEELLTIGETARQQVALDRTLERPGAELRAEALLREELERRVVPLDGPRAAPKPAALEDL